LVFGGRIVAVKTDPGKQIIGAAARLLNPCPTLVKPLKER
jgi:hypothetical protein